MIPHRENTRLKKDIPHTRTPNKLDVHNILLQGDQLIFIDDSKNIYGFIETSHKLYDGLNRAGVFDNIKSFYMWVSLPRLVKKDPSTYSSFPNVGTTLDLYDSKTLKKAGTYEVSVRPETIKLNSRTTSIVLTRIQ